MPQRCGGGGGAVGGAGAVVQSAKNVVANVTGCPERECSATTSAWAGTNSAHRVSARNSSVKSTPGGPFISKAQRPACNNRPATFRRNAIAFLGVRRRYHHSTARGRAAPSEHPARTARGEHSIAPMAVGEEMTARSKTFTFAVGFFARSVPDSSASV
jgi:hypothetical protein